jgi:DNA-directed RNA polymerase II subunit RPB2
MARHVIDTYFKDTANPMVRHHLDSFRELLDVNIPRFIKASNPRTRIVDGNRTIKLYFGGKDGNEIKYKAPVDEEGNAILPHKCRLENLTYAFDIYVKLDIEYVLENGEVETKSFPDLNIGSMPLMLKSPICYLSAMTSDELYEAGECKFELGGYFIINGQERVLLTQEKLGNNMFHAKVRRVMPKETGGKGQRMERQKTDVIENASKETMNEYICGIRSASEDGTLGPYGHQLTIPSENKIITDSKLIADTPDYAEFSTSRLVTVQLPRFSNPVPLISVFRALGFTSDQDIYDVTLAGVTEGERTQYDGLFMEMILSHERFTTAEMAKEETQDEDPDLLFLRRQTHTRSQGAVYVCLYRHLFPHCEVQEGESTASFYRRKGYLLGHMLRMTMDVALKIRPNTDRDHYRFKRLDVSGETCFQEFRRIYNETVSSMLTKLDSRIHYEKQTYRGRGIVNLVNDENLLKVFWSEYAILTGFEKSFKGQWGGKSGIAQVLARLSYLSTIHHLRRANIQIDKTTKVGAPIRRLHGSAWGLMCPTDDPSDTGMGKTMSLFCRMSDASPISVIKEIVYKHKTFLLISKIHPSTWNPTWSKVFLNSDLVGVITQETEAFHSMLINSRREQKINKFVSLTWNRVDNEYLIFTDAGRPCRPIYREGVKQELVSNTKNWKDMVEKYMDYTDAQESECLRINMESFHPTRPSEIHGLTIFAPSTSVIPHPEHSQAPRNIFSCQQTKQSCSWFSTAFSKRFDTLTTVLHSPQAPLSQTWTYRHVLGNNGCLPYGENAMIAIAMYTGYNQDDSLIINDSAIKRGMFGITYYHSYTFEEQIIDVGLQVHTEIANVAENPKYRESVIRKDNLDYSQLDGDGYIRLGARVTDTTVLVGMVQPVLNAGGQIVSYRDDSQKPKRGQLGLVDAVYRFTDKDGLRKVKIRIAEIREPVLGDKFAARSGQKGTCGFRMPEEDMPFTAGGLRPDLIVNPHGFPSRMTIGQFLESMSSKIGLGVGSVVDSTPFTASNRMGDVRETLIQMGYHPYGHEILYNGQTGEMMNGEIFMGPVYYLRLKHMVEDKINYRTTGPRTQLTHQPLEGRAAEGGLRIGEMERDSLLAHGMSKFLNESLMERSDAYDFLFQPEQGRLDGSAEANVTELHMPYAMRLFLQELESMHIQTKLASP